MKRGNFLAIALLGTLISLPVQASDRDGRTDQQTRQQAGADSTPVLPQTRSADKRTLQDQTSKDMPDGTICEPSRWKAKVF